MDNKKPQKKRAFFDRRSGHDRRNAYNIDYFLEGGLERRTNSKGERRNGEKDRRKDWIKISPWSSLKIEEPQPEKADSKESADSE